MPVVSTGTFYSANRQAAENVLAFFTPRRSHKRNHSIFPKKNGRPFRAARGSRPEQIDRPPTADCQRNYPLFTMLALPPEATTFTMFNERSIRLRTISFFECRVASESHPSSLSSRHCHLQNPPKWYHLYNGNIRYGLWKHQIIHQSDRLFSKDPHFCDECVMPILSRFYVQTTFRLRVSRAICE